MRLRSAILLLLCLIQVQAQHLMKREGSPCEWDNVQGTCVDARKCDTYESDVENFNLPPLCSFHPKYPVVCCTACQIFNNTFGSYKSPKLQAKRKTGIKHVDKCLEYDERLYYDCETQKPLYSSEKYLLTLEDGRKCNVVLQRGDAYSPVGGDDAKRGQYPHMALLGYGKGWQTAEWLCGGSIISERFILTAGHCRSHITLGPVTYVALGILRRSDPPELWQHYRVMRFISHPEYRPPLKYNDIALIETTTEIKFSKYVKPACIYHEDLPTDEVAYATGWGGLGHDRENADTLQEVSLQKFSTQECAALYPRHRHLNRGFDNSTQTCYGHRTEIKDTCGGDSGGPLQLINANSTGCIQHVIGVTSYGHACGFPGQAGMYTRVPPYVPWIESQVWPSVAKCGHRNYNVAKICLLLVLSIFVH